MAGFQSMSNALSGILASRRAIDVTSHNISNAEEESYSRQRAQIQTARPYQVGKLSIGRGVKVEHISRARDDLLDTRLRQETQELSRYEQLASVYREIENALNEPSEDGLRGTLSKFNSAMQELANQPENRGSRRTVIGEAKTFSNTFRRLYQTLDDLGGQKSGSSINKQIKSTLEEINNIGEKIASLNLEINSARAQGGSPNDLLDQRNELARELSEYIDATVQKSSDSYRVNVSGFTLVQAGRSHQLDFKKPNPGEPKKVVYDDNLENTITPKSGQLKALLDMRDKDIPGMVDQLNDMAVQLVDRFNDIHKNGFGLQGQTRNNFWAEMPKAESGVFRLEGLGDIGADKVEKGAGYIDSPEKVLAGDPSTSNPENFEADSGVQANPEGTLLINGQSVDYDMSEDTIRDVVEKINQSDNKAEAYLSAENRLVVKGAQENDYRLTELRDSGLLLDKTNILTVGGSNRLGTNGVDDPTVNLINSGANFDGDVRLDPGAPGGVANVDQGTLEFESSSQPDFAVNYDADSDSLEQIVGRINNASDDAGSNIAATVSRGNRLRLFTAKEQNLASDASAGTDVTVDLSDVSELSEGDRIRISDDTGAAEEAQIVEVDRAAGEVVVDELSTGYATADNARVQHDDPATDFNVNDTASQQLRADVTNPGGLDFPGGDNTLRVDDASQFSSGEEVIISENDPAGDRDRAEVVSVDLANDEVTLNQLSGDNGTYTPGNAAVRGVDDQNKKRNLLSSLGMDTYLEGEEESQEFAVEGQMSRPPLADQAAALKVSDKIDNNPDLIAAAAGDDVDNTGVADSMKGPGDGSNMNGLSNLHSENTLDAGGSSLDEKISEMTATVGSQASLANREEEAAQSLVNQIKDQIQSNSGVSLDEEMTKLVRHQQVFQASSRVISTVQTMSDSLLRLL